MLDFNKNNLRFFLFHTVPKYMIPIFFFYNIGNTFINFSATHIYCFEYIIFKDSYYCENNIVSHFSSTIEKKLYIHILKINNFLKNLSFKFKSFL